MIVLVPQTARSNAKKWGDGTGSRGRRVIHWDDEAVRKLLDREGATQILEGGGSEEAAKGKESQSSGLSELLRSFKVARFSSLEDRASVEEVKTEDQTNEALPLPANTPRTWAELLEKRYKAMKTTEAEKMGKGKRERRETSKGMGDERLDALGSESDDSGAEDDSWREGGQPGSSKVLLDRDGNGNWLVYGFTPLQRKAVRSILMAFGLMGGGWKELYCKMVSNKRLRDKTPREVLSYVSLVLKHCQEPPSSTNPDFFSDGVPREGLEGDKVFKRIGAVDLICSKLREYEDSQEEFFIDDGRHTGWFKAMSITSKSGRKVWARSQDLTLLRLVLKHGYGNWRAFLGDEDFLAAFPLEDGTAPAPMAVDNANRAAEADGPGEDGEDGEGAGGYTDGQARMMIQLVVKRMRTLTQALAIERQRMARRAAVTDEVRQELEATYEREMALSLLPARIEQLEEQREQLRTEVGDRWQAFGGQVSLDQKQRILRLLDEEKARRMAIHQVTLRLSTLAQSVDEWKEHLAAGPPAMGRLRERK
jgi:hypothetical protein